MEDDRSVSTNWDGLHNGNENPLAWYTVSLYYADVLAEYMQLPDEYRTGSNLPEPYLTAVTDSYGSYLFYNLEPGSYILALAPSFVGGKEYLPPLAVTPHNRFQTVWHSAFPMAYSEVIYTGWMASSGKYQRRNAHSASSSSATGANGNPGLKRQLDNGFRE